MTTNGEASTEPPTQSSSERPGRTRAHPAEELNSVLSSYCVENGEEFSPTAIRAIGTAVTKLTESEMLYMADEESIYRFLKIQNDSLTAGNFPFDVVEIALKILAAPDMPLHLYNDEWIKNIITHLSDICNNVFGDPDKKTELHRLFPMYRHLSHVVQQIHLSDPSLYKLVSISLPAYFLPASSPSLQTASCSLMTAIFKKYHHLRNDIILEVFNTIDKNQGSAKYVNFSRDVRKPISAVSRLFIEFVQSISSFPNDTESTINEIIVFIIQMFSNRSRSFAQIGRIYEKFVEDICIVLSHPFYPAARLIIKCVIESTFPSIIKKDDNTRIAVKLLCTSLTNILLCSKRGKEELVIMFPYSIVKALTGFDENALNDLINSPNSHIILTNEQKDVAMKIDDTFPLNHFEELLSHLVVTLYLQQSMKISEVINTSLPFSITLWSNKTLNQQEMDNMLLWWRGMLPNNINFEWTIEIAEKICLHELCRQPMFSHVHLLVQHLLKGLENKSSNVRAMILRGLSSLIEINPDLLFHPSFVSQIKDAFRDPSAPIRDSVLQIISKYIFQNEQSSSPYFSVVVNCLADSSPMVVKRALGTVGELSRSADEECLSRLCFLLSTKLNDESTNVARTARDALIQLLFENSKNPAQILANIISSSNNHSPNNNNYHGGNSFLRPEWFSKFFKPLFLKAKYTAAIKEIINNSFNMLYNDTSYPNIALVREFCEVFPKLCAPHHETLISIFNMCSDDMILGILPMALNSILKDITNPNISLFKLMLQTAEQLIYTKSSTIIRSLVELSSHVIIDIITPTIPTNLQTNENNNKDNNDIGNVLMKLFDLFAKYLRENLSLSRAKEFVETPESQKQVNSICRALFGCGCICRYYRPITQRQVNQIWGPVNHLFKAPVPKIRSMVLQCVCDICIRDTSQIKMTKALVTQAFLLGPPESVAAVVFLKNLIEEESKASDDTIAVDEIRPMYSLELIREFMPEVKKSFSFADSSIRSAVLDLAKVALKHGIINPPDIIQYIIAMLCAKDQSVEAIETLKVIIYHYAGSLNNRMKDGIKEAFTFVRSVFLKDIYQKNNDNNCNKCNNNNHHHHDNSNNSNNADSDENGNEIAENQNDNYNLENQNNNKENENNNDDGSNNISPEDDYIYHIGDMFTILQPPQQQIFLSSFVDILKEALQDSKADPLWINWIIRSLINFPFAYVWEPIFLIQKLTNGEVSTYINSAYTDAKAMIRTLSDPTLPMEKGAKPCVWYAAILTLRAKHYFVKKYQLQLNKFEKLEKDVKTAVKVAMIPPLNFGDVPMPEKKVEMKDSIYDLFAQFQSTMRMERSFGFNPV